MAFPLLVYHAVLHFHTETEQWAGEARVLQGFAALQKSVGEMQLIAARQSQSTITAVKCYCYYQIGLPKMYLPLQCFSQSFL